MLYYSYPQVVLQEVPNEISLALSISGCPLNCKGCHSAETRRPTFGSPLSLEELQRLLDTTKHLSCVLFYGGEWETSSLIELVKKVKENNLKVCLYTGLELEEVEAGLLEHLDYIKVGRYIEELGGLDSPHTNQKFLVLKEIYDDFT